MATDIVPSNLSFRHPITYKVSISNNFLESVQRIDYPSRWFLEDYHGYDGIKLHGPALVDPVFVSHDSTYHMWDEGQPASRGVGLASMYGTPKDCKLFREIDNAGDHVGQVVIGRSVVATERDVDNDLFVADPDEAVEDYLNLDADHTFISSIFRVAPSPCWFSGFHDFEPISDDETWYESFSVPVYPHTSNWASGTEYMDEFSREVHHRKGDIMRFTADTVPSHTKVFVDPYTEEVPPIAFVDFNRVVNKNTRDRTEEETSQWNSKAIVVTVVPLFAILSTALWIIIFKMSKRSRYRRITSFEEATLIV